MPAEQSPHQLDANQAVANLDRARAAAGFVRDADKAALLPHIPIHNQYLAAAASGAVERSKSAGLAALPFDAEHPADFIRPNGQLDAVALSALGLPSFEEAKKGVRNLSASAVPVGVVMHKAAAEDGTQQTTAVELLVAEDGKDDNKRVRSLYLENLGAVAPGQAQGARWIAGGDNVLARTNFSVGAKTSHEPNGKWTMLHLEPYFSHGPEGSAIIIRPKPSAGELGRVSDENVRSKRLRRAGLALGAFSVVAGFPPVHGSDPGKNQRLTSAGAVVRPAGTQHYRGVNQAEAFFTDSAGKNALNRSRTAFQAFFAGDKAALESQLKASGYHEGWIDDAAMQRVEAAQNNKELEAAFNSALGAIPIRLKIADTHAKIQELDDENDTHTPASNFDADKKLVSAALNFYNLIDKKLLKRDGQLTIDIVGSITDISGQMGHDAKEDGYYQHDPDDPTVEKIVLSEQGSNEAAVLVAHEDTHRFDALNNAGDDTASLNIGGTAKHPNAGYVYTGYANYENKPTSFHGWHVVRNDYGNADQDEDTATLGEGILTPHPNLRLENSPFGEKQEALIYNLEHVAPGFTAALLLRSKQDTDYEQNSILNHVELARDSAADFLKVAGGLLLLIGVANAAAAAGSRRKERKQVVIANKLRQNLIDK